MLLYYHFLEILMVKINSLLFRIGDLPLLHLFSWLLTAPIVVKRHKPIT